MGRIRSPRTLWLPLLMALVVVPACSGPGGTPPAATVDGVEIPRQEALEFAALGGTVATGAEVPIRVPPVLDAQSSSDALTLLVQSEIAEGVLDDMGGTITEADREQARSEAEAAVPNSKAVDRVTEVFAPLTALGNLLAAEVGDPEPVTEADVEGYYRENVDSFEQSCARVILLTGDGDLAAAREEAAEVKAQLAAGARFAELAEERSEDPDSAADGGRLPCAVQGQWSAVDPALEEAVWALEPGEVSDPVDTQFGAYLVKLDSRSTRPLADASAEIRQGLEQEADALREQAVTDRMAEVLGSAMLGADVTIDARFGRWAPVVVDPMSGMLMEAGDPAEAQYAAVVPPDGPTPG